MREVACDDPRCVEPLVAAEDWWRAHQGEDVEIARRPLSVFNDQPARNAAYTDSEADTTVGRFFSDTISTQATAYVRPREVWWPDFQTAGGKLLVRMLRSGAAADAIFEVLEALCAEKRPSS